ncbi:Protein unc-50 [Lobosporangium transversale]|nr:Protein unc-50 [Lobosporangium transversale]
MTILPLNSTPGRNTPTQQNASYFPTQGGPTIGIPSAYDAYGGRKADAGSGYGFGGMSSASNSSSSGRIHHGGRPHGSGETKNQWARDDPAFMVILSGILGCSAIAWGLVYGHGMMGILRMMLYMVFVDFVVIGLIVATICWTIANRFLTRVSVYSTDQTVEWQYAFDIHCNAFMPVIALLYIIQMVFMKVLLKDFWICSLLGNTLYLTAIVYYCYITFLGYNALPFVRHPEMFLYPITIFVIFYVIVLILGVNISAKVLTLYFG